MPPHHHHKKKSLARKCGEFGLKNGKLLGAITAIAIAGQQYLAMKSQASDNSQKSLDHSTDIDDLYWKLQAQQHEIEILSNRLNGLPKP